MYEIEAMLGRKPQITGKNVNKKIYGNKAESQEERKNEGHDRNRSTGD